MTGAGHPACNLITAYVLRSKTSPPEQSKHRLGKTSKPVNVTWLPQTIYLRPPTPEKSNRLWGGVADWRTESIFPENLATKIQDFMTNLTLSLIDLRNGTTDVNRNITSQLIVKTIVPATLILSPAVYACSRAALWQIYGTALGISIFCVVLGSFMLYTNEVAGQLSFSQVLVTTRNPTLDKISEGAGLGGKYITDRVKKVKVRYGKLIGMEGVGFGTEDEIQSLSG